jgi:hypothetical protein
LTHDGNDGILETDYGDLILDPADNDVWIKEAIPTLTLNSTESSPAIAYTRLNFSQNDVIKWQMAWDSKNQRLYWSTPGIGDCLIIHDGSGDVDTGASLYVNGNIHVSGDILSSSRTGRHTVSPPEFRPMDSSWSHRVTGDTLRPNFALSVPAPVYPFYAPVMLPDGVTVTKIIVNWTDNDTDHGMCMTLDRATHNEGTGSRMATTCCNGGLGERKLNYTTDIDDAVIDNVYYKYYLTFHVDGRTNGNLKLHGVRIQYEYSSL